MPELKDGRVVYTDAELAEAQQANDATAELRAAQAKADADSANALAMEKIAMQAAQIAQSAPSDA